MTRLIALVVCVCSLPVSAAIVYEPVQYQFGTQNRYYYGGSNPAVHHDANRFVDHRIYRDAEGQLSNTPGKVFSDSLPRLNGSLYGWTANDAKNEAYASIPRYFRKADLLHGSHLDCSGNLIVPATAPASDVASSTCGSIEIKVWKGYPTASTPKPILIVPKSQLDLDAPLTVPQGKPSRA